MITQLQKTLDALEIAQKEMKRLHRDLEQCEVVMLAEGYEVEYAFNRRLELGAMIDNVSAMLQKREKKALEQLRAQHRVQADLRSGVPEFPCSACDGSVYHFPTCPTQQATKP
jgi:hypothetical protein